MFYSNFLLPTSMHRRRFTVRGKPELSAGGSVTRLGLFVTQEELDIWRVRAISGPYKTVTNPVHGGVGTSTGTGKGDWDRVVDYKTQLMNNTIKQTLTMQAYQNTSTNFDLGYPNYPNRGAAYPNTTIAESDGSIDPDRNNKEPKEEGVALNASAFYAMVAKTINPTDADAVASVCKTILLAQVSNAGTAYPAVNTNGTKYHDGLGDTRLWTLTEFMIRWLFAYDYLKNYVLEGGTALFTSTEKTTMLQWFEKYANLLARNVQDDLEPIFANIKNGDLVTSGYAVGPQSNGNKYTHCNGDGTDGNPISNAAAYINNRRWKQLEFVGLFDVLARSVGYTSSTVTMNGVSQTLQFAWKTFFKAGIIVGIFEDGSFGEAERSSEGDPQKGYHYSWDTFQSMVNMAAASARSGDYEIINYTTNRGVYFTNRTSGTDGNPADPPKNMFAMTTGATKSLFTCLEWHINNVVETDPNKFRYLKTQTTSYVSGEWQTVNEDLIDDEHRLWHKIGLTEYVREARALPLTHFWKNAKLNAATTRLYQTNRIGSAAGLQDWWGMGEAMPLHFMFAQMENLVYPYPTTKLF